MFNENWYSDTQINDLILLFDTTKDLKGNIIEIGCWEGKSTTALANKIYPEILICNDIWLGNIEESKVSGITHITELILKERDIYSIFIDNMETLTKKNYTVVKKDCLNWLKEYNEPIKFIHIDASHDYESVIETIKLVLPKLVDGGVICGDDFINASSPELHGGVNRAVKESLPGFKNKDNLWYFIKKSVFELRLNILHSFLKLNHGSFNDEYPEQLMTIKYLTGNEKVLEIGGNIGRNSLVISKLLKNSANLVILESDPESYNKLMENRNINNLNFYVENSALSARKLIQLGWDTIPSEELLPGYMPVNTITLPELRNKYPVDFDTLVLDCEGAFYYILMDFPEILNGINLIIMENDYFDISPKNYIDSVLKEKGFYVDYSQRGGWGPCENFFYEVWKR